MVRTIYTKINDLLDQCKGCPRNKQFHNGNRVSPELICKGCANYVEIRRLGDLLYTPEKVFQLDMTAQKYKELRKTWKTDTKICFEENISHNDLRNWKKKHADEISDIPISGRNAGDNDSPNAMTMAKMSRKLNEANDEIQKLKDELAKKKDLIGISVYREMKQKLMNNIDSLTEKIDSANKQVLKMNDIAAENAKVVDAERNKNTDLQNQIDNLKEQLKEEKSRNESKLNTIHRLDESINTLRDEKESLSEQLKAERDSIKHYSDQFQTVTDENDRLQRMIGALETFVFETLKPLQIDRLNNNGFQFIHR